MFIAAEGDIKALKTLEDELSTAQPASTPTEASKTTSGPGTRGASSIFNTCHFSTPQLVAHGGGTGFYRTSNLPIGKPKLLAQPQCF